MRRHKPLTASLARLVQIVVLDLAEVPVVRVEDRLEHLCVAVERKADLPDAAGFFLRRDPFLDTVFLQVFPGGDVGQHVHQVVIDVVRAQAREFFVEVLVDALRRLDEVLREFGRDADLIADTVALDDLAEARLAAGVEVGRVEVVHVCVNGSHDLGLGLVDIDVVALAGKAHTAESQQGDGLAASVGAVLHSVSFLPVRQAAP